MILLKQDEISKLESRLEKLDRVEKSELFLGSSRFDRNEERKQVFKELDAPLATYGKSSQPFISTCFRVIRLIYIRFICPEKPLGFARIRAELPRARYAASLASE
jgi:hypothetical protein